MECFVSVKKRCIKIYEILFFISSTASVRLTSFTKHSLYSSTTKI